MNRELLKQDEKSLLEITAGDLIPELVANGKLAQVKQAAFYWYDTEAKQPFQVQIIVTRDENDFLEPFEIEELTKHNAG